MEWWSAWIRSLIHDLQIHLRGWMQLGLLVRSSEVPPLEFLLLKESNRRVTQWMVYPIWWTSWALLAFLQHWIWPRTPSKFPCLLYGKDDVLHSIQFVPIHHSSFRFVMSTSHFPAPEGPASAHCRYCHLPGWCHLPQWDLGGACAAIGRSAGVSEIGRACGQPKKVCGWSEGGTVSGVPLGKWVRMPSDGEDSSHHAPEVRRF